MSLTKDIAFVIPFSDRGEPRRVEIFEWNIRRLKSLFPYAQICIGEEEDKSKPINRSAMRNNGIKKVDRSILFMVDADTVWNTDLVTESIPFIEKGHWTIPYNMYLNLDEVSGYKLTLEDPDIPLIYSNYTYDAERPYLNPPEQSPESGLIGMKTEHMYTIGGYDERCLGWGHEDNAFVTAAKNIIGTREIRFDKSVFHIWHEVKETIDNPFYHENWDIRRGYENDFRNTHRKFI